LSEGREHRAAIVGGGRQFKRGKDACEMGRSLQSPVCLIRFVDQAPREVRSWPIMSDSDAADQLIELAAEHGDLAILKRLDEQDNRTDAEVLEGLTAE
jgi:hypothetical protein